MPHKHQQVGATPAPATNFHVETLLVHEVGKSLNGQHNWRLRFKTIYRKWQSVWVVSLVKRPDEGTLSRLRKRFIDNLPKEYERHQQLEKSHQIAIV